MRRRAQGRANIARPAVLPTCHAPSHISQLVKSAGLRPTRQRLAIGSLLFSGEHRHISADQLRNDAQEAGVQLSLATVYNTLNQFAEAGLVRRLAVGAGRMYFDTDVGDHQHFYIEEENRIIDIPPCSLRIGALPAPPPGYRIANVDITIRLSRIHHAAHPASSSCAATSACADCRRPSLAEGEPS